MGFYEKIVNEYPYDILADDATFRMAVINQFRLNNPEKAKELYQNLLLNYPGSIFVNEARKQFRMLRGDKIETEITPEELFFLNLEP